MSRYGGGNQCRTVECPRLAARLGRAGYRVTGGFDQNLRRCSPYNDEEAWEAGAIDPQGRFVLLFSWQTMSELSSGNPVRVSAPDKDERRYEVCND